MHLPWNSWPHGSRSTFSPAAGVSWQTAQMSSVPLVALSTCTAVGKRAIAASLRPAGLLRARVCVCVRERKREGEILQRQR
jgi:hypothetical protein